MLRHGWLLILCLLASSLVATAAVHAGESSGAAEMSCGGITHTENDTDPAPGDGDQGAPHHHAACHGHNVSAPLAALTIAPILVSRSMPRASPPVRLARRTIDPALKPPKA
jgi:hypothetical protein